MLSDTWLEPGLEPVPDREGGRIGLSAVKKFALLRLTSGDSGTAIEANVSCTLSDSVFLGSEGR